MHQKEFTLLRHLLVALFCLTALIPAPYGRNAAVVFVFSYLLLLGQQLQFVTSRLIRPKSARSSEPAHEVWLSSPHLSMLFESSHCKRNFIVESTMQGGLVFGARVARRRSLGPTKTRRTKKRMDSSFPGHWRCSHLRLAG